MVNKAKCAVFRLELLAHLLNPQITFAFIKMIFIIIEDLVCLRMFLFIFYNLKLTAYDYITGDIYFSAVKGNVNRIYRANMRNRNDNSVALYGSRLVEGKNSFHRGSV